MATYNNFGCNEFLHTLYEQVSDLSSGVAKNFNFISGVFTKQNIKTIISVAKDSTVLDDIEKIKELETIINKIIEHTNIKKVKFDIYNKKITEETGNNPLDKLVISEKYNNSKYLYYYTLPENKKKSLPYSKIALLSLRINPLHFYLNSTLINLYQQFCKYGAFLDCFFEIENVPNFFTEYCAKLGLNGLHILDIEIILGLLTKLLLLDFAKETYPKYDTKTSKITGINNVFDILFKWEHIDKGKVFDTVTLTTIEKILNKQFGIDTQIKNIIDILFQILTHNDKIACEKLHKEGLMSVSVYIAYVIKSFKVITPVLSFCHLGYLDDLSTQIIKIANDALNHDRKNIQKGGIIGIDNILGFAGLIGTLESLGLFTVIGMIFNPLKNPMYSCARSYYSKHKLDISDNISFHELSDKLFKAGDNIIINMITGTASQSKLSYLSIFLQTFSINDTVTKLDKLLLNPKICASIGGGKKEGYSPFTAMGSSYTITHKLIKAPTFIETGFFAIDTLYLVFSESISLFRIYDTLISKLFVECKDYTFGDESERVAKVIFSFIDKLSPNTQVILRQKLLSYIIIQNLYLLAEKYKNTESNKHEFYTSPDKTDPNKIKIFDSNIYKICKIITDIICITPDKHNKHLDKINEFILACLGSPNELFDSELTEILSKLVDYNFKQYRDYIVSVKLSIVATTLLLKKMQPNIKLSSSNDKFYSAINNTVPKNSTKNNTPEHKVVTGHRPLSIISAEPVASTGGIEEDTSFFSKKNLIDVGSVVYNKSKQKLKTTTNTTKKVLNTAFNSVYNLATNLYATFLSEPEPDITHIVELDKSISSIHTSIHKSLQLSDESTNLTIEDTITEAFNNIDEAFESSVLNDNHNTNKQKVHLFASKLFEYVLYISLPNIEAKLGYNIRDNVMICNETDVLLMHLLAENTNLLFETTKQIAKVRFINY